MILLDDAFMLTGIRERFPVDEIADGPNWLFVEQGGKKYAQLKPRLESILNPRPKAAPKPAPGAQGPGQRPGPGIGKGGPLSRTAGKPGTQSPTGRRDGWWNK
jgi:hypothetical protein